MTEGGECGDEGRGRVLGGWWISLWARHLTFYLPEFFFGRLGDLTLVPFLRDHHYKDSAHDSTVPFPVFATARHVHRFFLFVVSVCSVAGCRHLGQAEDVAVAMPLRLVNLNPFFVPYGVPVSFGTRTLPPGSSELTVAVDTASYLSTAASGSERLLLDGETYRTSLTLRRGFSPVGNISWNCLPSGTMAGCLMALSRIGMISSAFLRATGTGLRVIALPSPTRTAPAPESICAGTSLRCLIWCSASGIPCRIGWLRMTGDGPEPP